MFTPIRTWTPQVGGSDVVADPERRADRTFGIVLMRERTPKTPDHRVPDELLHDPAIGLDPGATQVLVGRKETGDVFVVHRLPEGRRADQVAEQGGDDLALLADGGGVELGSAFLAEPGCLVVRVSTRGAGEHRGASLRRAHRPAQGLRCYASTRRTSGTSARTPLTSGNGGR